MDLNKWLKVAGIGQRELARRLGYNSNGLISKIIKGKAYVPPDHIPDWAAALELKGANKASFIEECKKAGLPDWHLAEIRKLEQFVRGFVDAVVTDRKKKDALLHFLEHDLNLYDEKQVAERVKSILR